MTDKPIQQHLFLADDLIEEHKQDLEALRAKPRMLSTTEGIIANSLDQGLIQYHECAIKMLESDADANDTIDTLHEEELKAYMREQGYFICYR